MNLYHSFRSYTGILQLTFILVLVVSCTSDPVPQFSYTPADNPEAGDTIRFLNGSTDADSYEWDFGDDASSSLKDPFHIYSEADNYEVKLTALNEKSSKSKVESLLINDPTVMGIQVFALGEDTTILEGAEVWLYDNQDDWNNFLDVPPLHLQITDFEGVVEFFNVEPIVYYVLVLKIEESGFWAFQGYSTQPLEQNMANYFLLPCEWIPFEEKKAVEYNRSKKSEMKKVE